MWTRSALRHPDEPGFTMPASNPHVRLDYVFVPRGQQGRVAGCDVVGGSAAEVASDHLPVVTDLQIDLIQRASDLDRPAARPHNCQSMSNFPRPLTRRFQWLAACLLTCMSLVLAAPGRAFAQDNPVPLVVFGDSLSDPGNGFYFARSNATPLDFGMTSLLPSRKHRTP